MKKYQMFCMGILFATAVNTPVAKADEPIQTIGLRAFESTLFPALRQKCSQCHGDGGIAIGHSVSDVAVAYQASRLFVNFSNLEYSEFIDRVRSKHWKEHDPLAEGMTEAEMRGHLQNWWNSGESEAVPRFDWISSVQRLPAPLPTLAQGVFVPMKWTVTEAPFAGCVGAVEIQAVTGKEGELWAYRVRNPRFGCPDKTIQVQGVFFSVSNDLAPYENIYKTVLKTVTPADHSSALPLSSEFMILEPRKPTAETLRMMITKLGIQ